MVFVIFLIQYCSPFLFVIVNTLYTCCFIQFSKSVKRKNGEEICICIVFYNYTIAFTSALCSCGLRVLSGATCFQPEDLLVFLKMWVCCQQILSVFVYLGMSSFFLYFWRILMPDIAFWWTSSFFQHFKYVILLLSDFLGFWWEIGY